VFVGRRSRILPFLVVMFVAGCHRKADGEAVKRSLDGLKSQLGELTARFADLRKQVEAVSPDLPGFSEVRARFYATEEGRGVIDAKVTLLSSRLDAASSAGKRDELEQISKEIAETYKELGQIDQLHVALLHQVMAFQRMALRRTP
jgi:uncharacterized membrane protein